MQFSPTKFCCHSYKCSENNNQTLKSYLYCKTMFKIAFWAETVISHRKTRSEGSSRKESSLSSFSVLSPWFSSIRDCQDFLQNWEMWKLPIKKSESLGPVRSIQMNPSGEQLHLPLLRKEIPWPSVTESAERQNKARLSLVHWIRYFFIPYGGLGFFCSFLKI